MYGLGQALFQVPADTSGITVSGYPIGSPTPDQIALAQEQAYQLGLENFNQAVSVGTSSDASNPFSLPAILTGSAGSSAGAPSATPVNWLTIGLIAGGLLLLGMAVKR
jgi:hypothetical protein